MMGVPIQDILFTVFQSIFQVFLLCLAGFILSLKGIVDKPTSKVLNHINIALFTPALLFSKVAYFLSPAKLRQLWVIPIFFVVLTGSSAVIAHCLARACRLRRSQVNFATAASMFMNSNSLPVALMQSLATTVPILKRGSDDTIDAMFSRSLTYLVVFSTLGMILRWSYGVRLLSQADEPAPPPTTYRDADDVPDPVTAPLIDYGAENDIHSCDHHVWSTRPLRSHAHPRLSLLSRRSARPHVHHSHLPAVPTSLGDQSESESDESDELDTTEGGSEDTIALRPEQIDTGFSMEAEDQAPPSSERTPRWVQPSPPSFFTRILGTLTSLSPPLVASLFALLCVLVPPLQRVLNSEATIPFKGALDNAGACSVPITLIVLGGWFWDGDSKRNPPASDEHGSAKGQGQDKAKGKDKATPNGVEKRHVSISIPHHIDDDVHPYSRDSSTTSLSSMIGAFGDVLLSRIYPRRSWTRRRAKTRGLGIADAGSTHAPEDHDHDHHHIDADVEAGAGTGSRLATHAETEIEHAENMNGRGSRSRSRGDGVALINGRVSPVSPPSGEELPGETLTVVVTLLARMVLVPLIATPLMVLVSRMGWGGEVFEDPVFIVSSMLLTASPPALTLAQISQRTKPAAPATSTGPAPEGVTAQTLATESQPEPEVDPNAFSPFERLFSRTVFWSYLVLTPPITIMSVMVGLLLIEE